MTTTPGAVGEGASGLGRGGVCIFCDLEPGIGSRLAAWLDDGAASPSFRPDVAEHQMRWFRAVPTKLDEGLG